MLALARADDAFAIPELRNFDQFERITLAGLEKGCLHIPWKEKMLDKPLFRATEKTVNGRRTSAKKPLRTYAASHAMKRLGLSAGFRHNLTQYCLRRGTGNAVDGKSHNHLYR